jgi:hypothetical protein
MGGKLARGALAAGFVEACALLVAVAAGQGLVQAGYWAAVLSAVAGLVVALAAVWAVLPARAAAGLPSAVEVPGGIVGRPAELAQVTAALTRDPGGMMGITTGLYGAGGFGKTTLAKMACADPQVRKHFGGRIYPVTVGRDRDPSAVATLVNEVIKLVAGENATFTDPQLAGAHLGSLLNSGPRKLLVLDDVWRPEQLAPFTQGGRRCARLVTTRVPELLAGRGTTVRVDQMTPRQARELLTSGLPPLDEAVLSGLLDATGRWPLLVRLVNKILADHLPLAPDGDVTTQAAALLDRLRSAGPAALDDLTGNEGHSSLDAGDPNQRAKAVRATIEASTSMLSSPKDAACFAELGVFAEDATIPFKLLARLWKATTGLDDLQSSQLCSRLAQLALISQTGKGERNRGITVHDVIRDFLRTGLSRQHLAKLNGLLLDTAAAGLPTASTLDGAGVRPLRAAWWDLDDDDPY